MVKIVGYGDFVRGFRIIGAKEVVIIKEGEEHTAEELLQSQYNLIILDGRVFKKLKGHIKDKMISSKKPLFFILDPTEEEDEGIKMMIKKVLGVEIEI